MSYRKLKLTEEEGIPCYVCGERVGDWHASLGRTRVPGFQLVQAPLQSLVDYQEDASGALYDIMNRKAE